MKNLLDHEQWNYIFDSVSYRIDDFTDAIDQIRNGTGHYGELDLKNKDYIIEMLQEKIQQHEDILTIIGPFSH